MATKIILKKSTTGGSAPGTADLDQAELAVNLVDRKIYTKDNGGTIVTLQGAYVDSTAPGNPAEGDLWYDTANNMLKTHDGSSWTSAGYTTLAQFGVNATAEELNILDGATLTTTELNYVDGVTSAIQTQLDGKAASSHTHAASDVTSGTFADGRISQSSVTQHETALSITESQISDLGTYLTDITGENLGDLSDVTLTSIGSGEILKWNGTAWVNNTLAEAGIQAAGSYLTAESDTLATVTGRGASSAEDISLTATTTATSTSTGALTVSGGVGIAENLHVGGNTMIGGNLTVEGTTTSVNSTEVNIGDAIILLNAEETAEASLDAGIEIERGTDANVKFFWDESADSLILPLTSNSAAGTEVPIPNLPVESSVNNLP